MHMPEPGPFGETFFEARLRATVAASFVKSPADGWVESVVTRDTQRFVVVLRRELRAVLLFVLTAFLLEVGMVGPRRSI